ncbi:MAG: LysE family translocator [Pseudomonadales bacterium]
MEVILPLLIFVLVSTITPGPNNFLLATSGIKFGFQATWRHVFGIHCGIYLLVLLCGLGLGQILAGLPEAMWALKLFGTGYLIYLAWKILGFDMSKVDIESNGRPMGFIEAAIFQFSNPKAWMMVTTGLNIGLGNEGTTMLSAGLYLCMGFATVGLCCNLTWLSAGASLRQLWLQERYQKRINGFLAVLTLLAIATFWWM